MPQSPRLVELLLAQANGADDDLRSKLVTILGTQRDPRVIKQLVTWLQDINPGLQRQVTTSLIALNEPGTVELLLPLLSDTRDAVCLNAALILSQIGISDNAMKTSVVRSLIGAGHHGSVPANCTGMSNVDWRGRRGACRRGAR